MDGNLPSGFPGCSGTTATTRRSTAAVVHEVQPRLDAPATTKVSTVAAVPAAVHNTPFGDIVDTEDDLQPLVATAFKDATRAVALVAAAMPTAEFDVARMRARAAESWVTVTELADTLARDHGVPFKAGHAIASKLIRFSGRAKCSKRA